LLIVCRGLALIWLDASSPCRAGWCRARWRCSRCAGRCWARVSCADFSLLGFGGRQKGAAFHFCDAEIRSSQKAQRATFILPTLLAISHLSCRRGASTMPFARISASECRFYFCRIVPFDPDLPATSEPPFPALPPPPGLRWRLGPSPPRAGCVRGCAASPSPVGRRQHHPSSSPADCGHGRALLALGSWLLALGPTAASSSDFLSSHQAQAGWWARCGTWG